MWHDKASSPLHEVFDLYCHFWQVLKNILKFEQFDQTVISQFKKFLQDHFNMDMHSLS